MSEFLKKEKIKLGKLSGISGGMIIDVNSNEVCCKPGSFKVLENKENEWRQNGCPEKCKYCWHLKYNNGFYCEV